MNRRRLAIFVVAISTIALSGCMRITSDYVLNENDTVSGEIIFAISDAALEGTEDTGEGFGGSDAAEQFENATVTEYKQDGFTGERVTFVNEPLATLSSPDSDLTVVREGDEYVVTGPDPEPEVSPSPGQPDESAQLRAAGGEARISVTFPGEVTSHNGTLDGRTVTWDLLELKETPTARGSATLDESIPAGSPVTSGSTTSPGDTTATPIESPTALPTPTASASASASALPSPTVSATPPASAETADLDDAGDDSGVSPLLILGIVGAVLAIGLGVLAGWLMGRNKRNAAAAALGDQAPGASVPAAPYVQPATPADPFLPTQGDVPPAP